ncbi:MAG: serine/threonine protein kinase [Fuerstiella sp.]|nr:serine/threonine protein kinase [Fuerstiella sp.]
MKFTFVPEASPLEGYTIKRAIHRGGFGEVYYALSDSGKEVALKLLHNNLEVELRGVSQCLNLKHQNLVTIFDIREDRDGDHWIVMEYIGGRGLYDELQRYPNGMPIDEVLRWLSGMTAGLSFLHDRGIVHRDLKPANVFCDQDTVKVGDVGLSKYISESRRSAQTQSVGTVYYMAPEVCHGRYGREVDVYALGIILVEMLTGQVPFDGETTAEILMKHMTTDPELSALPAPIQTVIAAALEKDPKNRIQDVEELEQRFRDAVTVMAPVDLELDSGSSSPPPVSQTKPSIAAGKSVTSTARPPTATVIGDYWTKLPALVKWIVGGIVTVILLEAQVLSYITSGAFLGIFVYTGYLAVRYLLKPKPSEPVNSKDLPKDTNVESVTAQRSDPDTNSSQPPPLRRQHRGTQQFDCLSPATPRAISTRQRISDLVNSLSISLAATCLVTLAVYMTTNLLHEPVHAVFFGSVTMLGAWALLILSKLREGRPAEVFMRRVMQGAFGLGVGFLAAGLQNYLMLSDDPLLHFPDSDGKPWVVGRIHLADGSGYPTLSAFMMFFGILFAARRWWWQADSFRKSRFRISSTLVTLLAGAVVAGLLQFPGALGATWALAISAVVQLSAAWTPQAERLLQYESSSLPLTGGRSRKHASVTSA